MNGTKNSWLRYLLILWTLVLTALMSLGSFSKAHIGSITWGPTTDMWAMSIAISKIKYDLSGGIGYRLVLNELTKELTTTNSDIAVNDEGTAKLDDNPANITRALINASQLPKSNMPSLKKKIDYQFVTVVAEDIGYANYYAVALKLFGLNAYSTHYLYFSILLASLTLYLLAFWRSNPAIIILVLLTSSLFMASTSTSMFSVSIPSFASNRFLSTLALFPLLHCIVYSCLSTKKSRPGLDQVYLILQMFLFAFTLKLRTSSSWMIVAYAAVIVTIMVISYCKSNQSQPLYKSKIRKIIQLGATDQIKTGFIVIVTMLSIYNAHQCLTLNKIYYTDAVMPHHMFWHSAYLGLSTSPHWSEKIPYPKLANASGDGIAWGIYELNMIRDPNYYRLSSVTGLYKTRIHENLMRKEFFKFAFNNPYYMLQLYFYYKPHNTYLVLKSMMLGIPMNALLVALLGLIGSGFLAIKSFSRNEALTTMLITMSVWYTSLLPVIWAYPAAHIMSDQFLTTILLFIVTLILIIPIIFTSKTTKICPTKPT